VNLYYGIDSLLVWNERYGNDSMARTLIHFPIIHTREDMGMLGTSIQQAAMRKTGRTGTQQKARAIEVMWDQIARKIDSLGLAYETVRLYQDGLPVCGREMQIVTDLAEGGGRNHQLLLHLSEKGAVIMGTESRDLLMEEYALVKDTWDIQDFPQDTGFEASQKAAFDSLLKRRDQFIAERINTTLNQGETGILFLGMLHSVDAKLSGDIRIVHPLNQPFSGRKRP